MSAAESAARIRAYLDMFPDGPNIGTEIAFSDAFASPSRPHRGYALDRADLEAVLDEADRLRAVNASLTTRDAPEDDDADDMPTLAGSVAIHSTCQICSQEIAFVGWLPDARIGKFWGHATPITDGHFAHPAWSGDQP